MAGYIEIRSWLRYKPLESVPDILARRGRLCTGPECRGERHPNGLTKTPESFNPGSDLCQACERYVRASMAELLEPLPPEPTPFKTAVGKPEPDRPRRRQIKQPKDRNFRICTGCLGEPKPISEFAEKSSKCRACRKAYGASYWLRYKAETKPSPSKTQPEKRNSP